MTEEYAGQSAPPDTSKDEVTFHHGNGYFAEPLLEQPSQFLETLDKLQEFKRFFIALVFLGIFGAAILAFILIIGVMVAKGQYDGAIEAGKWLIAIVGTTVGTIVGFYFGNNQAAFQKG